MLAGVGDVTNPVLIPESKVEPEYPELARVARLEGNVILQAIIDRNGDVVNVRVIKGQPMGLSEKAIEAIRQWKFQPATLNGKPVDVYYNLTVNFRLQ